MTKRKPFPCAMCDGKKEVWDHGVKVKCAWCNGTGIAPQYDSRYKNKKKEDT